MKNAIPIVVALLIASFVGMVTWSFVKTEFVATAVAPEITITVEAGGIDDDFWAGYEEDRRRSDEIVRVIIAVLTEHKDELEAQGLYVEAREGYFEVSKGKDQKGVSVVLSITKPIKEQR